jgi:hypothetical protein
LVVLFIVASGASAQLTKLMNDENIGDAAGEADSEQTTKQATGTEKSSRESVIEVIKESNATLQALAHSDLPVAEDARRALAMTDAGVDMREGESDQ